MRILTTRFYQRLIALGTALQPFLLLAIRLYWGLQFFMSGLGKFLHLDHTVTFFDSLGIPFPLINAYVVATVETVGGLLLALGFLTRLVSIPLMLTMLVAYATAHLEDLLQNPSSLTQQGPFLFLFAALIIFVCGPGVFSIDAWLSRRYVKGQQLNKGIDGRHQTIKKGVSDEDNRY
jgi:putative oxidoreductase